MVQYSNRHHFENTIPYLRLDKPLLCVNAKGIKGVDK